MKSATSDELAYFESARTTIAHDLWTFVLLNGQTLRWTSGDRTTMTSDGRLFGKGPTLARDTIKWQRGVQTNTCKVTLGGDATTLIAGVPLVQFATADGFSGAGVTLERAYYDVQTLALRAVPSLFSGLVGNVDPGRYAVELELRDGLSTLDIMMPSDIYQPQCLNTLFDTMCAVDPSGFRVNISVAAIDPTQPGAWIRATFAGKPSGFFQLGRVLFTSGDNVGLSRSAKRSTCDGTSTDFFFGRPFPFPIKVHDTFTGFAGCDRTQATCFGTFGNLPRFRGTPYIPDATTVT